MHRIVAALGAADRIGTAHVAGSARSALLRPLRLIWPIGWIGGKYSTSKPMARIAGRRADQSSNVPWRLDRE